VTRQCVNMHVRAQPVSHYTILELTERVFNKKCSYRRETARQLRMSTYRTAPLNLVLLPRIMALYKFTYLLRLAD